MAPTVSTEGRFIPPYRIQMTTLVQMIQRIGVLWLYCEHGRVSIL